MEMVAIALGWWSRCRKDVQDAQDAQDAQGKSKYFHAFTHRPTVDFACFGDVVVYGGWLEYC